MWPMSDTTDTGSEESAGRVTHWLSWTVLIAIAIGAVVAGRKIALNSTDKDL